MFLGGLHFSISLRWLPSTKMVSPPNNSSKSSASDLLCSRGSGSDSEVLLGEEYGLGLEKVLAAAYTGRIAAAAALDTTVLSWYNICLPPFLFLFLLLFFVVVGTAPKLQREPLLSPTNSPPFVWFVLAYHPLVCSTPSC